MTGIAAQRVEGSSNSRFGDRFNRSRVRASTLGRSLRTNKLAAIALVYLALLVLVALFAPIVAPFDPNDQSLLMRNQPPMTAAEDDASKVHPLGTDFLGRDQLSRLMYGGRVTLLVAGVGVLLSGFVGTTVGVIGGYFRGKTDDVLMRVVDLQMSFPTLLMALIVLYVLGPGIWNLVLVLAVTRWPLFARVSRGLVLSGREQGYIEAARATGAGDFWIITRHLLPNLVSTLLVLATIEAAALMLAEAALSFLGLGLGLGTPSWGLMLSQGRPYISTAWWLVTFPGLAILFAVLSLNLIGRWARDVVEGGYSR